MEKRYYGTLGPACNDIEILRQMFLRGMSGMRLNLSHVCLKQCEEMLRTYFQAAQGIVKNPELIIDLQGPELRIGNVEQSRTLFAGERVYLAEYEKADANCIGVPKELTAVLSVGHQLLVDDGKLLLQVEKLPGDKLSDDKLPEEGHIACQVLRGGELFPKKSIAVVDMEVDMPTLSATDHENLACAKKYGVTGVMLPFVRSSRDLENLKQALKEYDAHDLRIFAKIETLSGVEKLEELLPYCHEIVIARGDLGNRVPLWELPVVQEDIATRCREYGRDFMVVTQMLASMEHSPVPTRAEVSDIYRAIQSGAASVMLTGETAAGQYPVEAMTYLVNTAKAATKKR